MSPKPHLKLKTKLAVMNITVFSFRQAFAVMWKLLPDLNRNFSLESLKDCFKNRQKHQSQNFTIPQSGGVTATSRFPTFCWSDDRPLSVPLSPRRIWISDRPAQFDPRLCWSTYLSPPKKINKTLMPTKTRFFFRKSSGTYGKDPGCSHRCKHGACKPRQNDE